MGQVTIETLRCIREYAERGENFPLTLNEMQQLAFLAGKGLSIAEDPNQMRLFSVDNLPVDIHFPYDRTFKAIFSSITVGRQLDTNGYPTVSISVSAFTKAFNEYTKGAKDEQTRITGQKNTI